MSRNLAATDPITTTRLSRLPGLLSLRLPLWLPHALLWLAMAAYAAGFAYLTLVRYAAFEARALDMGNLNQAVWNTAFGEWFHFTNQPGAVNRLSLHVEPILIPIAWLYRIYSGPPTLLIIQSAVVALGAWPLFALARRQLASAWLGLAFGLAFLLNPTIQAANWLEFHPVTLAPTFLMAAFYFLVAGRTGWFTLFAVLAASCKEEIGLLVFMQGVYAFLFLKRRMLGLVIMGLSAAWSLTAVLVIQNLFATGNIHWGRYNYLGDSPLEMVLALLTQPHVVWTQLQAAGAGRYLVELLAPVGFLPLLAPHVLLLALPSLGINLLADFPPMHQVYTLIYAAPVVPFVMLAAVMGAAQLCAWARRYQRERYREQYLAAAAALLVLVAALAQQYAHGYLPGGGNYRLYPITEHHTRAAAILAQIPPEARVSAQDKLNPHVSGRETVYIFPRIEDADTVLVDVTGPAWPQHPNDLHATIQALLNNSFGIAAADNGYLLLTQSATAQSPPPEFYSAWHAPDYMPQEIAIEFDERLRLVDYGVMTDAHGELVTRLYWQALAPLDETLGFYVAYRTIEGVTLHDTEFYPPVAQLWYPTTLWPVGDTVGMDTLPWTLDLPQDAARFGLYIGVYSIATGLQPDAFLPVTAIQGDFPVVEQGRLVRLGGYEAIVQGRQTHWQPVDLSSDPMARQPERPLDAWFDGQFTLTGIDIGRTPEELDLTFYWHAAARPAEDYAVFVHVLNEQGVRIGQLDWQPRDAVGPRPMTTWRTGERLVDRQRLTLSTEQDLDSLRLLVGVYRWQDGQRLPVLHTGTASDTGAGYTITGDTVEIRNID